MALEWDWNSLKFELAPKPTNTRIKKVVPVETDKTPMTRTLGERIRFKKRLHRSHNPVTKEREWRTYDHGKLPIREGIIIGWRNLANGAVDYGGYDEGTSFIPSSYVRAYLVVDHMRQSPFYVLPSDILAPEQPEFDYAITTGPRKRWDDAEVPPEGEGWVRDTERGRNGWERFDYHEESYWKRPYSFYLKETADGQF